MMETGDHNQSESRCPHCLAGIAAEDHFCATCDAPLTSHAATDPIKSIWARGYVWRTGIRSPRSTLILVGFWLLFGGAFLVNLFPFYAASIHLFSKAPAIDGLFPHHDVAALVLILPLTLAIEVTLGSALYQVTRNFIRGRGGRPRETPGGSVYSQP